MPPVGFEPTFSAGERPQTYSLDRAASGIGCDYSVEGNTDVISCHSVYAVSMLCYVSFFPSNYVKKR